MTPLVLQGLYSRTSLQHNIELIQTLFYTNLSFKALESKCLLLVELPRLLLQLLVDSATDLRGSSMLDVLPKRHRHRLHDEPEWTGQPVIECVAG